MMMDDLFRSEANFRLCQIIREEKKMPLEAIKMRFIRKAEVVAFVQRLIDSGFCISEDGENLTYIEGSESQNGSSLPGTLLEAARMLQILIKNKHPFDDNSVEPYTLTLVGSKEQPEVKQFIDGQTTHLFIKDDETCAHCRLKMKNYGFLIADWRSGHAFADSVFYLICAECSTKIHLPPSNYAQERYPLIVMVPSMVIPSPLYPFILLPPQLKNSRLTGGTTDDRTEFAGREGYTFQEGPTQIGKTVAEMMPELEAKDHPLLDEKEGLRMIDNIVKSEPHLTEKESLRLEQRKRADGNRLEDVEWLRCLMCDKMEKLDGKNVFSVEAIKRGTCDACEARQKKALRNDGKKKLG